MLFYARCWSSRMACTFSLRSGPHNCAREGRYASPAAGWSHRRRLRNVLFVRQRRSSRFQLLGAPDFICNQRGFLLRPYLGLISPEGYAAISPSSAEVAEVFTVPFAFFQNTAPELYSYDLLPQLPEGFPYEAVGISQDYPWSRGKVDVPVWYWQGHVIWGMTARIVRDLAQTAP